MLVNQLRQPPLHLVQNCLYSQQTTQNPSKRRPRTTSNSLKPVMFNLVILLIHSIHDETISRTVHLPSQTEKIQRNSLSQPKAVLPRYSSGYSQAKVHSGLGWDESCLTIIRLTVKIFGRWIRFSLTVLTHHRGQLKVCSFSAS